MAELRNRDGDVCHSAGPLYARLGLLRGEFGNLLNIILGRVAALLFKSGRRDSPCLLQLFLSFTFAPLGKQTCLLGAPLLCLFFLRVALVPHRLVALSFGGAHTFLLAD